MGRLHDAVCGMEGKKALLALCCWLLNWTFRSMPRYTWSVHIALILNSFRGHFCCGTVGSCPCCVTRYTLNPCHRKPVPPSFFGLLYGGILLHQISIEEPDFKSTLRQIHSSIIKVMTNWQRTNT